MPAAIASFPEKGPILPYLATLSDAQLDDLFATLAPEDLAELERERFNYRLYARIEQLPPDGEWGLWILQGGRGGGKTWAGANATCEFIEQNPGCRFGLFGTTAAKVRDVMIEDRQSGILAVCPPWLQPNYESSKRRITFKNGSRCITYSADNPDQSRGANLDGYWADEVGEWRSPDTWHNLQMAVRMAKRGKRTRGWVSTTPRPTDLIRDIMQGPKDPDTGKRPAVNFEVLRPAMGELPASYIARPRPGVVITRWSTDANKANLASDFLARMKERYAGTRLGRQELGAEILDDTPGALWNLKLIEELRIDLAQCPRLERLVVSVDPSHSEDGSGDACGIIVAGTGGQKRDGYVRADRSLNGSPLVWAQEAVKTYDEFRADAIVYEDNEIPGKPSLVRDVLRTVDPNGRIRWIAIHSSRDKKVRADPVSALYEQKRVHHVRDPKDPDQLSILEDELTSWDPTSRKSPNRLDAAVHGLSYLMLGVASGPTVAPASVSDDDGEDY